MYLIPCVVSFFALLSLRFCLLNWLWNRNCSIPWNWPYPQWCKRRAKRHDVTPFDVGKRRLPCFLPCYKSVPFHLFSLRVSKFSQIFCCIINDLCWTTSFLSKIPRRRVTEKVSIALPSRFCPGGVPTSPFGPRDESQWCCFPKRRNPKGVSPRAQARLPPADVDFLHWREAGDGYLVGFLTKIPTRLHTSCHIWCQLMKVGLMKVGQESWWLTCWLATRQWLVEDSCPYSWMSITRCFQLVDYSVTRQPFWKPPRSNLTPQYPVGWLEIWDIRIVSHSPPQTHEKTAQPKSVNLGSNLIQPHVECSIITSCWM